MRISIQGSLKRVSATSHVRSKCLRLESEISLKGCDDTPLACLLINLLNLTGLPCILFYNWSESCSDHTQYSFCDIFSHQD